MTLPILLAAIVTNVAPDGVNTIITDTETGVTQSTLAYVYRPNSETIPGLYIPDEFRKGSPQTVIIPGADTRFVVMSEAWYDDLTNRVAKTERDVSIIRSDAEKSEKGRVKFHGERVRVSENAAELKRVYFYADGWSYTEHYAPVKPPSPVVKKPNDNRAIDGAARKTSTNPRYEAALKRREAAKNAKPIEYNEIHIGGR